MYGSVLVFPQIIYEFILLSGVRGAINNGISTKRRPYGYREWFGVSNKMFKKHRVFLDTSGLS